MRLLILIVALIAFTTTLVSVTYSVWPEMLLISLASFAIGFTIKNQ